MIPFFRKIRKKMADDNRPLMYMRYAIGEIVLVVIGILIALSINNWNELGKEKEKTNLLLEKTQKELLYNINRCNFVIDFYRGKDSLIYKVSNKKLTYNDYKSNPRNYTIIHSWEEVKLIDNAFNNLTENDGKLSGQQDSITLRLKNLYGTQKIGVDKWDDRTADLVLEYFDEMRKEKEWYSKREGISEIKIEYFLTDPFYFNDVRHYSMYKMNHLVYIGEFRDEALGIYEEISDYLDLKKDTTVVKNMNDYKHYIGRYEGDSLYNAQIIRKNNTLKLNLFAKNDTIILESMRVYPDSKTYSIIGDFFSQSFFDEDNKVSKIVLSIGPFREELKKID
jgi:hypothetical protein